MSSNNDNNDEDLYDEFGNYIGPDLDDDSSSDDDEDEDSLEAAAQPAGRPDDDEEASDVSGEEDMAMVVEAHDNNTTEAITPATTADAQNQIVLHEDKEHYASATETFGEDVRTAVLEEDAMDLETPIVAPILQKSHTVNDDPTSSLSYLYSEDFLTQVLLSNETTSTRRCVAICGHLGHGKTCLVDTIVEPTLATSFGPKASLDGQAPRLSDTLKAEQERHMSLKSTPWTFGLSDTRGKSYGITLVDCPGHVQFHDESVATMRLVDGVLLVVDCVEGLMMHTELLIQQAVVSEGLPILLCLSKLDRLIVELKLPPKDAYFKLLHIIEQVNDCIAKASKNKYPIKVSPELGNVCFSSSTHGWIFTLESFAQVYADHNDDSLGTNLSIPQFAKRLWGDWYWDATTRQFHTSPKECTDRLTERTFTTFILEPIYKIYSVCLGEAQDKTNAILRSLGILLTRQQLRSSARPLLRAALSKFLAGAAGGLVDMMVRHVPTPQKAAYAKIRRHYSGPMDSPLVQNDLLGCSSRGKLVIHVTKLYSSPDGSTFDAFGRIYSGTIQPGQRIKVLGESYVPEEDEEDCAIATVEGVAIPRGRSQTSVSLATAGNWVLLQGIDATIAKTATLVGLDQDDEQQQGTTTSDQENAMHIFKPLRFPFCGGESIVKLALEPLQPAELPKMVEGLRRVSKSYPMVQTRVEESGEHVLFGTGELYMDCVLHDLRSVHADVEVKVADPIVAFRETVVETSSLKCFAEVCMNGEDGTVIEYYSSTLVFGFSPNHCPSTYIILDC